MNTNARPSSRIRKRRGALREPRSAGGTRFDAELRALLMAELEGRLAVSNAMGGPSGLGMVTRMVEVGGEERSRTSPVDVIHAA